MALPLGATYTTPGDATALPGLNPANVGSVGSDPTSQALVSTLYDYDPFSIIRTLFQTHSKVSDFRFLLKAFGMTRMVSAPTTGHYEDSWLVNTLKLGATVTPSAGAGTTAILGLHADSMLDLSLTASGVGVKSSAIELNQVVLFPNGVKAMVVDKNTATDPHRITLKPLKSTDEIPAVTSGDEVAIMFNAYAEGTSTPNGWVPRISKYTNEFQIVKEGGGSTGTALTDKLFVEFPGVENGPIFAKINMDMMARFERWCNNTLLFGVSIDNITTLIDSGADAAVKGTEGFEAFIDTYGHTLEYTVGAFSLADFDAAGKVFQQERTGSRAYMTLDGYDIFTETENLLLDQLSYDLTPMLMKNAAASYGNVSADDWQPFENQDFEFYVGFKGIRKNGFSYAFKQLHEFSDVTSVGNAAYNYGNQRYIAPIMGQAVDKKTGAKGFSWGYEYKGLGSYKREENYGMVAGIGVGGAGGYQFIQASNTSDYLKAGIVAEIAFHAACPNQVFRFVPAA